MWPSNSLQKDNKIVIYVLTCTYTIIEDAKGHGCSFFKFYFIYKTIIHVTEV